MSFLSKKTIYQGKSSGSGGGGGGSTAFNGNRAITRDVIGLEGITPGGLNLVDFLNATFYPPEPPTSEISEVSGNGTTREVGAPLAYDLAWAIFKGTNNITGITVDGTNPVPTGGDQSGNRTANFPNADQNTYVKSVTATDGTLTTESDITIKFLPRYFWGTSVKDGVSAPILDADILALADSALTDNRALTLANFGGGATYLVFAFPSAFGTPNFTVNGLVNTAFTRVRAASNFVNSLGYTVVMDVWVSNNLYNSPLDSVIIS